MGEYINILILKNEIEAQVMDELLTEQNIPHYMRSYHDLVYDGLFQLQKGWGHIEAPEEFRHRIHFIYDVLKKSIL